MSAARVAILAIGSELLSGDTKDTNTHFMARELTRVGASLRRIVVVPDEVEEIAHFARDLSREFDVVFACGGIGPTHDDVTLEGIAHAFGVPLVEHAELIDLVAAYTAGTLDAAHRRLALIPQGSELVHSGSRFPVVRHGNVYILPGIPRLLEAKFTELLPLVSGEPELIRQFRTDQNELAFSAELSTIQAAFPNVAIGSYPTTVRSGEWFVRLTLKSRDRETLDRACGILLSHISGLTEIAGGSSSITSTSPAASR